jgi:hypothetical protein
LSNYRIYSFICLGVSLVLFLFTSVERLELVADAPGALSDQKALEIAKRRGLWPVLVNPNGMYSAPDVDASHLFRYVDIAYLGNSMLMMLFFIAGLLFYVRSSLLSIKD